MKLAISLSILTLLTGCASYVPAALGPSLLARDGDLLRISGTPTYSDLGASLMYLCPMGHTGESAGDCLDLIASAGVVSRFRSSSAQCIVVSGRFRALRQGQIGTGYFRSDLGYVEVAQVAHAVCHNESIHDAQMSAPGR